MFIHFLNEVNQRYKLPSNIVEKLNREISQIKFNEPISPEKISRKTNIELSLVADILMDLYTQSLLNVKYCLPCNHGEEEKARFEFNSKKELKEFILQNPCCPHCGSPLKTENLRVTFIKKKGHG